MAISRYRYFDKVEFSSGGAQRSMGWDPDWTAIEPWRVALRAYVADIQAERKKAS